MKVTFSKPISSLPTLTHEQISVGTIFTSTGDPDANATYTPRHLYLKTSAGVVFLTGNKSLDGKMAPCGCFHQVIIHDDIELIVRD